MTASLPNGNTQPRPKQVDSSPIFLNEFLKLTLPPIDALAPSNAVPTTTNLGPAYTTAPISEPTPLTEWPQIKPWSDFPSSVTDSLDSLSDNEAYQHILAPCAFRKGDLPQATLLPSVHLWVIINVWQPMNRIFDLDEEKAFGGYDAAGHLRSPLFIGDHLPQVAAQLNFPIPRQAIFRPTEPASTSIAALVLVREPWFVDLTTLFEGQEVVLPESTSMTPLAAALAEILAYMRTAGKKYAVLTTYSHFVFIRNTGTDGAFGPIEISQPISATDTEVTVYAALWYWSRLVAAEQ
ncbi:hypothetical protein CF319_g2732 [Tilletia indica]|nr:hypothetical protein CF319_g2732 [Tilletia indica]